MTHLLLRPAQMKLDCIELTVAMCEYVLQSPTCDDVTQVQLLLLLRS